MAAEHVKLLGERIRLRREHLKMTQEEVARAMPGKVSGARISLWERGENKPRDDSLEHLAVVLGTTVAELSLPTPEKSSTPEIFGDHADRLARIERKISEQLAEHAQKVESLVTQQNDLLARQSKILMDLEARQRAVQELLDAQLNAARKMEAAAANLQMVAPVPQEPQEGHRETPPKAG